MKKITPQLLFVSILAGVIPDAFAEPPVIGAVQPSQASNSPGLSNKVSLGGGRDMPISTQLRGGSATNSVGAIPVTPQLINAMEKASQTKQNINEKYLGAVNDVKIGLQDKGYQVTTVESRTGNLRAQPSDYYVRAPDGTVVEVSTSELPSKNGTSVEKVVTVTKPGEDNSQSVAITITHANAKAVKIAESSITPSAQAVEAAAEISYERGNIVRE